MRPMKAGPYVPEHIRFPLVVQPKWDGWRGVVENQTLLTATLKPIPNRSVREYFQKYPQVHGLDGELTMGDPTAPDCFNKVDTHLKRFEGEPDFTFRVFDLQAPVGIPFMQRYEHAMAYVYKMNDPRVVMTHNVMVYDMEQLLAEEERLVLAGYEGAILRDPNGVYKNKRSTSREGYCIKMKRFEDSEARIDDFEELYSNQNEATLDERGLTKRQSLQENMVPMDTLGAFLCTDIYSGVSFRVGSFKGLDMYERSRIWRERHNYLGRIFTYKFQKIGGYEKPRIPIFKGWRSDLSPPIV